jgi:hypothetical protein
MLVVPAMSLSFQESILGGIQSLMSLMSTAGIFVLCLGVIMFLYVVARDRAAATLGRDRAARGRERTSRTI